jgi:hypothetical protein
MASMDNGSFKSQGVSVMRVSYIYRIYTEQKNKRQIISLAAGRFESLTTQPTTGYYRTKPKNQSR